MGLLLATLNPISRYHTHRHIKTSSGIMQVHCPLPCNLSSISYFMAYMKQINVEVSLGQQLFFRQQRGSNTTKNGQTWAINCLKVRWHYANSHYYMSTWLRIYYLGVDCSHWMVINAAGSWTTCPLSHFKFTVLWDVMPCSLIEIYQTFERKILPQSFRILLPWRWRQ